MSIGLALKECSDVYTLFLQRQHNYQATERLNISSFHHRRNGEIDDQLCMYPSYTFAVYSLWFFKLTIRYYCTKFSSCES